MRVRGILCLTLFASFSLFAQQKAAPPKSSAASQRSATTNAKPAEAEAAKVAEIRRLLELTGTRDMVNEMKSSMLEQFRRNAPGMPNEMLNEMMAELKAEDLVESMI